MTPTSEAPSRKILRPLAGLFAAAALAAGLSATPAAASSEDAWAGLRMQVAAACQKLALDRIEMPVVTVDPFGSENYGLALVRGKAKGAEAHITSICVFDKKSRTVELGSELTEEMMRGTQP